MMHPQCCSALRRSAAAAPAVTVAVAVAVAILPPQERGIEAGAENS